MYKDFNDVLNNMLIPELNSEDFLLLLLSSNVTSSLPPKMMITQNFNYNLNPNGENNLSFFMENVKFKANIFLESIKRLSPEEYESKQNNITNNMFISFMKYLSSIDEEKFWEMVKLKRDANIDEKNKKKRFIGYYEKLLGDKHGFDFNPASRAWYYFRSYTMSPGINDSFHTNEVKHRLYIAINYDQLMSFTCDFIKELESLNQPYLLKIKSCNPSGKCAENDTLVIYADTERRVTEYVNIINKIISKYKKYKDAIHVPSAHLGNIDNIIGYGREFCKESSYSGIIGEIGYQAIKYALQDVLIGIRQSKNFSKSEMINVIEQMKYSSSLKDIFDNFKDKFWNKFYELMQARGYTTEDSICIGNREEELELKNNPIK